MLNVDKLNYAEEFKESYEESNGSYSELKESYEESNGSYSEFKGSYEESKRSYEKSKRLRNDLFIRKVERSLLVSINM